MDFFAFAIPMAADLDDAKWAELRGMAKDVSYVRRKDVAVSEAFFVEAKIPYVPLLESLRAKPDTSGTYFPSDGHFTPEGAHAVAVALKEYLMSNYFSKPVKEALERAE